jgi:hypothetical protein
MKTACTFQFQDEPQFRQFESREYLANLLRAWKRQPDKYILARKGTGLYACQNRYNGSPVALVTTR